MIKEQTREELVAEAKTWLSNNYIKEAKAFHDEEFSGLLADFVIDREKK